MNSNFKRPGVAKIMSDKVTFGGKMFLETRNTFYNDKKSPSISKTAVKSRYIPNSALKYTEQKFTDWN